MQEVLWKFPNPGAGGALGVPKSREDFVSLLTPDFHSPNLSFPTDKAATLPHEQRKLHAEKVSSGNWGGNL